ncbi:MAG: outer membrane beta-barrel protein [Rhizobiales bacterium]|nr:outer membrane beta-barrel protein [Hyphomicrobiales bacterium]
MRKFKKTVSAVCFAATWSLCALSPAAAQQADDDPFAPLGLRAGSFLFLPEIEVFAGYNDNAAGVAGGASSSFTAIEGQVTAQSDWSSHSLTMVLRGGYTTFSDVSNEDDGDFDAEALLVLDILRETQLAVGVGYEFETEDEIDDRVYSAEVELSHRFNRLTASVRGAIDDFDYGNRGAVSLGSVVEDEVADYRETEFALRLAYEVSPRLSVYGEVSSNRRDFDRPIDANGFLRGSDGYAISTGATVEISDKLRGSVSIGYQVQTPDDAVFADIEDFIYAADLTWFVTQLTNIVLVVSSNIGETVLAGSSGEVGRDITIEVNHALRRNVELTASLEYGRDEFIAAGPVETDTTATFGVTYLLNRNVAITGSYSHYEFESTDPGVDYDANIFLLGLRLQR